MPTTPRNTLINWFKRGLKPLESQFAAWLNSYWHQDDSIPIASITGLQTILNSIQTIVGAIVATAGADITFDFANTRAGIFTGDNPIGAAKEILMTNAGNAISLSFIFNITGAYGITFPANFKMAPDPKWDNSGGQPIWTPAADFGQFQAVANFDGADWNMTIEGPFA
jgi:hypothetical protein